MGEISSVSVTLSLDRSGEQGTEGIGARQDSTWGVVCRMSNRLPEYGPCMQEAHTLKNPVSSSLPSMGDVWLRDFQTLSPAVRRIGDAFKLNLRFANFSRVPDWDGKRPKRLRTRGNTW